MVSVTTPRQDVLIKTARTNYSYLLLEPRDPWDFITAIKQQCRSAGMSTESVIGLSEEELDEVGKRIDTKRGVKMHGFRLIGAPTPHEI